MSFYKEVLDEGDELYMMATYPLASKNVDTAACTKDDNPITVTACSTGLRTWTYKVSSVTTANSGKYQCVMHASSAASTKYTSAEVEIDVRKVVYSANAAALTGQKFKVTCTTYGTEGTVNLLVDNTPAADGWTVSKGTWSGYTQVYEYEAVLPGNKQLKCKTEWPDGEKETTAVTVTVKSKLQ